MRPVFPKISATSHEENYRRESDVNNAGFDCGP